jgi:hypothetical protein
MKIYKLEYVSSDGIIEDSGYFINKENAEKVKVVIDQRLDNKKYGIIQHIVEIETED